MEYTVSKMDVGKARKGVVVFAKNGARLLDNATAFDDLHHKTLAKALRDSRFQGDSGVFDMPYGGRDRIDHVTVVGMGKSVGKTMREWRDAGISAGSSIDKSSVNESVVIIEEPKGGLTMADAAEAFVEGVEMAMYRFDRFKTEQKDHQKLKIKKIHILVDGDHVKETQDRVKKVKAQAEGQNLTRELVNLPANYANPDFMAETAEGFKELGIEVEILGETEMKKLGMGMLLAVGQGSSQESRLIVMKYNGAGKKEAYKAIVGKGVMFDTGGYDIKPAAGMLHMKCDMGGAGAVMGTMKALAKRKSKVNVIGVCGCVMNMVSEDAFLPSDILTSYKGLTVEVLNTDAEGRLVLGDALAYTIDKYEPSEIIDLATLTGACMISLGSVYAGLFTNTDRMATNLSKAGEHSGERVWRLPVGPEHAAMLKSKVADMTNLGETPFAGASSAAAFLEKFVGDTPWTHLDIAGVAMNDKIPGASTIDGASGFGVRLLVNYLESNVD